MDQGSNKNHSPAYNFTPTVTKFCVMWEGLSLPHDTKFGNCRCKIVDSRSFHSWSLIHGLRWSGLIKVGPGILSQFSLGVTYNRYNRSFHHQLHPGKCLLMICYAVLIFHHLIMGETLILICVVLNEYLNVSYILNLLSVITWKIHLNVEYCFAITSKECEWFHSIVLTSLQWRHNERDGV